MRRREDCGKVDGYKFNGRNGTMRKGLAVLCLMVGLMTAAEPALAGGVEIIVTNPEYAEPEQTQRPQNTQQPAETNPQPVGDDTGVIPAFQEDAPEEKTDVPKDKSVLYTDPETKETVKAQWKRLGTAYSQIVVKGESKVVPTAALTFGDKVPENQKLAVIYTPRNGRASMRKKASVKSAMFYTCYPGVIVAVLKPGKSYTQINYQGVVGYVKTSSLQFHAPEDVEKISLGKLSYRGKTTGKTTVNLRNDASKKSVTVAAFPTGTEVTVLSHPKGWYEIEVRGYRGFVQEEYLTPNP